MAELKGRLFLLKLGDGATAETFTTIAGLLTTDVSMSQEAVEVTTKDSAPHRKLVADTGTRSMSISATGVFQDDAALASVRSAWANGTLNNYQLVYGNGDKLEGAFLVTAFSENGAHNGAMQYSMTLESSGAVPFTAA